jgi:hypothetical protein
VFDNPPEKRFYLRCRFAFGVKLLGAAPVIYGVRVGHQLVQHRLRNGYSTSFKGIARLFPNFSLGRHRIKQDKGELTGNGGKV